MTFKSVQHESHVRKSGLDRALVGLVYLRISQMNGCAYCIDMHSKDLRAHGETEQRLLLVSVFREAPAVYTERERAAFAWAEAVTNVGHDHVPRDVFEEVRKHFDEGHTLICDRRRALQIRSEAACSHDAHRQDDALRAEVSLRTASPAA